MGSGVVAMGATVHRGCPGLVNIIMLEVELFSLRLVLIPAQ
jgi:hypothetical protein